MIRISKETVCNSLNIVYPQYNFSNKFTDELYSSLKLVCHNHILNQFRNDVSQAITYTQDNMYKEPDSYNDAFFFSFDLILSSNFILSIPEHYYKEVNYKPLTNNHTKAEFFYFVFNKFLFDLFAFHSYMPYENRLSPTAVYDNIPAHIKFNLSLDNFILLQRINFINKPKFQKMSKKERSYLYFALEHYEDNIADLLNDNTLLSSFPRSRHESATLANLIKTFLFSLQTEDFTDLYKKFL